MTDDTLTSVWTSDGPISTDVVMAAINGTLLSEFAVAVVLREVERSPVRSRRIDSGRTPGVAAIDRVTINANAGSTQRAEHARRAGSVRCDHVPQVNLLHNGRVCASSVEYRRYCSSR